MSQSLAKIYVHAIFSTKQRVTCLYPELCAELYPYAATVLKNMDCSPIQIGGVSDHLHILCAMSKHLKLIDFIAEIKRPTSKWVKTQGAALRNFSWQSGYGAFSVSQSQVERVRNYIVTQTEHHRRRTFQEEFRAFLKRYQIEYDERYVWD